MEPLPPLPNPWPKFDFDEPATRKVQTRKNARDGIRTLRGISMFIAIFGLVVVFFHVSPKVERMVEEGQVVRAQVEERYQGSDDGTPTYHVEYLYQAEGYLYTGRMSVSQGQYEKIARGEEFPITFLPSDPNVHEVGTVGDADVQEARKEGSLTVLWITLPFSLLALGMKFKIRQERRILSTWLPLPGQVLEITKMSSEEGDFFTVRYRVPLPNGKVVTQKANLSDPFAKHAKVGSFFPVFAPPGEVYIQERLRPLFSLSTVHLASFDPARDCFRLMN